MAAERVAQTVAQGVHGRRRVGQGETFWQFRRYEFGDPTQLIDWRQSAKSDHVFVREMEWEAAQSVWIWRDASPSMDWRSKAEWQTKRERADLLALALVVLLVRGGERVTLLGSDQPLGSGRSTLSRLALLLEQEQEGAEGLPTFRPLPRHAQVVFFSDFLTPLEEVEACLRCYAERGIKGHLVHILDPAEETLPYGGRIRFDGLEGEESWLLSRVESVREHYVDRLEQQRQGLRDIAQRLSWSFASHRTDRSPQAALMGLYLTLSNAVG